jgi:hypothetical protein
VQVNRKLRLRFDSDYSECESEYFDASSEEHSSDSDYFSDGGPAKLVEPIGEDRDGEASDLDAEDGTPIIEEATVKTIDLSVSQAYDVLEIILDRFRHGVCKTTQGQISRLQPAIHQRLERRYHQLQLSKNYGNNQPLTKWNHCRRHGRC